MAWSVPHGVDSPFRTTTINCCMPAMSAPSWHDRPSCVLQPNLLCLCPPRRRDRFRCSCFPPYRPNMSLSSCCLSGTNSSYSFVPHFPCWPSMSSSSCYCCLSGMRHRLIVFVWAPIPIVGQTCVLIHGLSNSESFNFVWPPPDLSASADHMVRVRS